MSELHSITDAALRYLGPHPTGKHNTLPPEEFILGSKPLHDAKIADNRLLSFAQLAEAVETLRTDKGAQLAEDADLRRHIRFLTVGTYMLTDDNSAVFLIKSANDQIWFS